MVCSMYPLLECEHKWVFLDGPETMYMVVFAKLETQHTIQLVVARLTTKPPDPRPRPRPDDPIPRKPPLLLRGSKGISTGTHKLKRADSIGSLSSVHNARELKRVASIGNLTSAVKKPKLDVMFKVPGMPTNAKGKGKARQTADEDVFGLNLVNGEKGHNSVDGESEFEKTNKNVSSLDRASNPTPFEVIDD